MVIIGLGKSLSIIVLYKRRCLENIKTLCKSARKCDDKQKYNAMDKSTMVSTPEGFNDNSRITYGQSVHVKKLVEGNLFVTLQKDWT